jgi:hypothetical protein
MSKQAIRLDLGVKSLDTLPTYFLAGLPFLGIAMSAPIIISL